MSVKEMPNETLIVQFRCKDREENDLHRFRRGFKSREEPRSGRASTGVPRAVMAPYAQGGCKLDAIRPLQIPGISHQVDLPIRRHAPHNSHHQHSPQVPIRSYPGQKDEKG